jgi:ABC-type dipeptide/oligopeptide/nickel transport system permease subunit
MWTFSDSGVSQELTAPRTSEAKRMMKVMSSRGVVIFGVVIIVLFIIVTIFAPLLAPYDPNQQYLKDRLLQPSAKHLLGTDELGRDTLSRLIYGARISMLVGVVTAIVFAVIGMSIGLVAGYFGGWVQTIIMRCTDAFMAIPPLVLMMAIAAMLGGGLKNILISLSIGILPTYIRLMFGQVLTVKETDYITAASIIGDSDTRIMLQHLLPNTFPPLLVLITLNMGGSILMEATLSYLGIGIGPPTATWGNMVSFGYRHLVTNPVNSLAPGLAILLVVLAFNMVGDGLRDALDPRLRGTI